MLSAVMVLVLAGCASPGTPADADADVGAPAVYSTGDNSELVTTLPVKTDSSNVITKVVMCVNIDPVTDGSIIYASAEAEYTNDLGYDPLIASMLILVDSCTLTAGAEVTEHNGEDCTRLQHHCVVVKAGLLQIVGFTSRHYVSLIAYAAHTQAKAGDVLKVQQDYGRLNVLVWR
jgi:hypothetical protein